MAEPSPLINYIGVTNTNITFCDYIDKLIAKGYTCLGSGCSATVYGKPRSRKVFKIGKCKTDAWLDYVYQIKTSKVRNIKNNPWLPRIHNITFYQHELEWYYVAELERLTELQSLPNGVNKHRILDVLIESVRCFSDRKDTLNIVASLIPITPQFKQVCILIQKAGRIPDIHVDNVMLRGKQLVITDPIC